MQCEGLQCGGWAALCRGPAQHNLLARRLMLQQIVSDWGGVQGSGAGGGEEGVTQQQAATRLETLW